MIAGESYAAAAGLVASVPWMEFHVDDDGFVRAPRGLVYRRLTDVAAWPGFWPGCAVSAVAGADETHRVRLRGPGLQRRLTIEVTAHTWRHDEGFRLDVTGDVTGSAEFWLQEGWGGTVVHHLASLEAAGPRPRAAAIAYRSCLRRGLWGLKDDLQAQVLARLGDAS